MSNRDAQAPRVFLVRHGATSWAEIGRYTSTTDIDLTGRGVRQVSAMAHACVGTGKLMDPSRLGHVFVSPRLRAMHTLQLLLPGVQAPGSDRVTITEDIAEWWYGDYEGLTAEQIVALRKERGLDTEKSWSIWRDGCEGGESEEQVAQRLQRLIARLTEFHRSHVDQDVLVVAHGLILRCLIKLWVRLPISFDLPMTLEPGSVTVLSYKEGDIERPCLYPGIALPSGNA